MFSVLLLLLIVLGTELYFKPRLEYLEEESILILFYSAKNTRKRLIFKI